MTRGIATQREFSGVKNHSRSKTWSRKSDKCYNCGSREDTIKMSVGNLRRMQIPKERGLEYYIVFSECRTRLLSTFIVESYNSCICWSSS